MARQQSLCLGRLSGLLALLPTSALALTPPIASVQWEFRGTANLNDTAIDVATDSTGNAYITGQFANDRSTPTPDEIFLFKFQSTGALAWSRFITTPLNEQGYGVGVDGLGNVVVVGTTEGSLGRQNDGRPDAVIIQFDASGNQNWLRQVGSNGDHELARAVAADDAGNAYVTLEVNSSSFLRKYDVAGNLTWERTVAEDAPGAPSAFPVTPAIAVDKKLGNLFVGGYPTGTLTGMFVSKFDVLGNLQWSRKFGTQDFDSLSSLAADGLGNVYATGSTSGPLGGPFKGGQDVFVTRFDADGTRAWTRQVGTFLNDNGRGIVADGEGNVYVTGSTDSQTIPGRTAGAGPLFLSKYNSSGDLAWTFQFGRPGDIPTALAHDGHGGFYVSGFWDGPGGSDPLLVKVVVPGLIPEPGGMTLAVLPTLVAVVHCRRRSATCMRS